MQKKFIIKKCTDFNILFYCHSSSTNSNYALKLFKNAQISFQFDNNERIFLYVALYTIEMDICVITKSFLEENSGHICVVRLQS